MKEDAKEISEFEEYKELWQKAKENIYGITLNSKEDDRGVKKISVDIDHAPLFNFFWKDSDKTFGLELLREEGSVLGSTRYTFEQDGKVNLTGYADTFGDGIPDLLYAQKGSTTSLDRKDPITIDLEKLRELSDFIEHPVKAAFLAGELAKLPGEENIYPSSGKPL